ncbi:hypothetical protein GHT06_016430 [Daphnia sinensis]|uniref:Uncharacterized protein n=1 Tax=Daphnia sinensis TaxID=1820382 RepID=A0AAD5L7A4_9CRUS|nr:hypothetical protein GHT06_016430 [Daphnia sinensis]
MNIKCAIVKTYRFEVFTLGTDVVQTASINSYAQFYRLTRLPFRSTFDYSAGPDGQKGSPRKERTVSYVKRSVTVTRRILAVATTCGRKSCA